MAKPTKNNPEGKQKKPKLTPGNIAKLEQAFAIDATVDEACFYAGISRETYYRWIKENLILSDKFERLRNTPVLKARQTVVNKIGESYSNAMDYLKRKKKLEFGDNMDMTTNGKDLILDSDIKSKIDDSISIYINGNKSKRDTEEEGH